MPGLFGLGGTATAVLLAVAVPGAVVALVSPPARRAWTAGIAAVGRWPGLIRAELPGRRAAAAGPVGETTPDIPPVTRGLPIIERLTGADPGHRTR